MLRAQLGMLLGSICFIYIFIDLINGMYFYMPWYIGAIIASALIIYFNRKRKYLISSIIFLLSGNMLVFLIASLEDSQGGAFFYFITTSATGLVLLNPINKRLGIAFVGFSLGLAGVAYFSDDLLPLQAPKGGENYEMISFAVNFTLGLISSILVLVFVMDRNEESENVLIKKQNELTDLAKELEKSKNRYVMALYGSEAGIYEWDFASNKVMASVQFKKLLGYDADDDFNFDFDSYKSLIHIDDKVRFSRNIKRAVENGSRYQHEVRIKQKSGIYRWFLDSGVVSMKKDVANLAVGSIIDIHESKNVEQQLRHKNVELEKTNEELDSFVYRASHDMRAPLSTLLGLLNLAKTTKAEEELEEYHELMSDRINTMDGFIKEVTDYSRNARLAIRTESINVFQLVEDVIQSFGFLASEACVEFNNKVEPELEIISDRTRLNVVLSNIIYNAIKYHDITKTKRFVCIETSSDEDWIVFRIIDNGIGIDPELQENIFDMFFRASEKSTGSGLGLYIVKETLERLNGTISCNSKKEEGSTFTMKLPYNLTTIKHETSV